MAKAKKATSSLLNRQKSGPGSRVPITMAKSGVSGSNQNTTATRHLKPLRARQLIRRYHTLIKYKSQILKQLGLDESEYVGYINERPNLQPVYSASYDETIKTLKVNKTPKDMVINLGDSSSMIRSLGEIDGEIYKRGGLNTYQIASQHGQQGQRGGDSSKVLIPWLKELELDHLESALEIGCLSVNNIISRSKIFDYIERIDLNSQEPGITKQDFLHRPIDGQKFDLISCSLVLNFVPNSKDRGKMIQLFSQFLKNGGLVFLVLPLPCIENSRYITEDALTKIFKSQGLSLVNKKTTHKLYYSLFKFDEQNIDHRFTFKKDELNPGGNRNNFSIVL